MKYMLMLQGSQAEYEAMGADTSSGAPVWTEEDLRAMVQFMQKLNEDLAASGELVDGQGLTEPSKAGFVTAGEDGRPVLSDEKYGVDQQVLAGYWLLECESFERATEIAARVHQCPGPQGASNPPVIVRPVAEGPPAG
ncbi:YciI family protein [Streptomyces albidus (ex Kaewkla and Franco 2022)]|uniref:YciI family protein n=1 Tax=Streptomyces albidus (ex Kaewkla and Franco 2022) TaxID=722709 RepID=UPI0015EEFF8F|nr:YciI family protein [Streptomyces albidus (ex Kaewkla and Franco 2022)]